MMNRLVYAVALAGALMSSGSGFAQTNQPTDAPAAAAGAPPAGSGSKVEALPGSTPGDPGTRAPSPPTGAAPAGSGSKAEAVPPPDTSTAGPTTATTPVPAPSAKPTPSGTQK